MNYGRRGKRDPVIKDTQDLTDMNLEDFDQKDESSII
jgi:hypothetical protein